MICASTGLVEGPEVATAYFDSLALNRGAADGSLRSAAVPGYELFVIAVVDVVDPFEAGDDASPDLLLADRCPRRSVLMW